MKDIFIDNNIAKDFATPINPNYKPLIKWLLTMNGDQNDAYLVLSKKLLNEYLASSQNCAKSTSINIIVDVLTKQGRINGFTNNQINDFIGTYFKPKIINRLRCNKKDQNHIPIVLLSNRQIALTKDNNFAYDLVNFPKFSVIVTDCPSKIEYL